MSEIEPIKEPMKFIEKILTGNESPSCVDGRPDKDGKHGPQMLGGSLHPLVLKAITVSDFFDESMVRDGLEKLKAKGFLIGVHRGHHKDPIHEKSDCGFGDRLVEIIQTAKENKTEIIEKLQDIYRKNRIDTKTLQTSYTFIDGYDLRKICITGEKLIKFAEENQAATEDLEGDHRQQAAFVNLKKNTTLDTQEVNKQGKQAFNLDLWAAVEQSSVLASNVRVETLRDLSLILYLATKKVLVVDQGKPDIRVILNQ